MSQITLFKWRCIQGFEQIAVPVALRFLHDIKAKQL
jgi:hypothetical protein